MVRQHLHGAVAKLNYKSHHICPSQPGLLKLQMSPELLKMKESTPGLRQPKKEHRLASSCFPCAVGLQQASCEERLTQASR